jgi:hypothetical protein
VLNPRCRIEQARCSVLEWPVGMWKLAGVRDLWVSALALWMVAAHASAEVRLDWHAADGCPDAATVTRAMNKWLETTGTPVDRADVQLDAEVESSPSGYELALELRTRSGARRMQMFSETCDVFAQVIAVQASLLITSAEAEPPQTAAAPSPPRKAAEVGWPERAFALRAQGVVTSSPLPGPAFGLAITGAYVALPLRLELTVGYLFARELRYQAHPEVGGDLQSGLVGLRPCAAARFGWVELSGCVGAEAGLIRGQGIGVSAARATVRSWFAVALGGGLHVLVTPVWSVWLGVDLLTSLNRPVFYVAQLGALYRPERFGVRGTLGIELRIW